MEMLLGDLRVFVIGVVGFCGIRSHGKMMYFVKERTRVWWGRKYLEIVGCTPDSGF